MDIRFIFKWVLIGTIVIGLVGFGTTGYLVYTDYQTSLEESFDWEIRVNGHTYYSNIIPEVGPNIVTFIDGQDGKIKSFIGYRSKVWSTRPIPQPKKKALNIGG